MDDSKKSDNNIELPENTADGDADQKTAPDASSGRETKQETKQGLDLSMMYSRSATAFENQTQTASGGKDENALSADEVAKILKERVFGQAEEQEITDILGRTPDSGSAGADSSDAKTPDSEVSDAETPDSKTSDAGSSATEASGPSASGTGHSDTGTSDTGMSDTGMSDTGMSDAVSSGPHRAETDASELPGKKTFDEETDSAVNTEPASETDTEEDGEQEEETGENLRDRIPFHMPRIHFNGFRRNRPDNEDGGDQRSPRKWSEGSLRIVTWVIIAAAVVAAAFLIRYVVKKWNYKSLEVSAEQTVDNPVSSSYVRFGTGVLRYSADSATYIDGDQKSRWEITYSMAAPKVDVSGDCVVLYDSEGSTFVVCGTGGEKNRVTTDLPVSSAVVSERGTVAAVMSDGSSTRIEYYSSTGEEISTIRTSMSDPGYPMSVAVSDDGMLLAVSYLAYTDSTLKSEVCVYSFDSVGQAKVDNIVGKFDFEGTLIPELRYLGGDSLVVFRDDGFTVIEGGSVPAIVSEVKTDSTIESLFYNDRYVGYVLENDSDTEPFILNVFDLDGREMTRVAFSFTFETVEFSGTQISLYNRDKLCVYGIDGEKKFEGSCGETPNQFLSTGTRQYVISDEKGIKWLRLH